MILFGNKNLEKYLELKQEIEKIKTQQYEFLEFAHKVISDIQDQSKKKFMYEIQQEDIELIEDGKKLRKIRKIID